MHRGRRDSVAFTVVVGILVLLGALAMALVIALSGAPGSLALAAFLAAIPVGPLVGCFMWLDRYEPEPRNLLVAGLLWGAFVATAAALVFQGIGMAGGASERDSLAVVAPLTEEATKGAFLLLLLWWRRHELDGVLDGIVYAGMVGIGFAYTENILYLAAAYDGTSGLGPGGTEALTGTFIVRCLISPFAHPFFTVFTGIGVGLAIASRHWWARLLAPLAGFAIAAFLHGLWNSSTLDGGGHFFVVYGTLMFPAFLGVVAFAVYRRRSERPLLTSALQDAAARGLLPATDIPWLVDLSARRQARRWAKARAGQQGERAMRGYQAAAIELGYLHHRYLRGTAPDDFSVRGQEHVDELRRIRPYISFPGQVVPTR
ncbi:Membrane proteinase PrsW, cleaves anti-sigma factor RsiW, M82 family [Nocardioides exalbidus]|uniref:Membrane proteinase PrsW, cleaves anti-sigma factor RsiW, M82 family n=1 Tax=Nocardioides exalbidus TaxID=402596 RepID=A0A1H4JIY1_9ACTN|nr:PrsW family intramembrane metalloprotease [Nocardioides exalbidus]SEB46260.1 Membrane proteinase PrsW, cleaves anti-sigma factor RsiW, M82 family [Nocardioides exalbidus]